MTRITRILGSFTTTDNTDDTDLRSFTTTDDADDADLRSFTTTDNTDDTDLGSFTTTDDTDLGSTQINRVFKTNGMKTQNE